MVFATTMREYREYFEKVHIVIYGEPADEAYANLWAKIVWTRQDKGFDIDLPSIKTLKKAKNRQEQIKMLIEGVYG